MTKSEYLSQQLLTYIGNKRKLIDLIEREVIAIKDALGVTTLRSLDGFSGSGVVSRMLKYHSHALYVNDMEPYCDCVNRCFLSQPDEPLLQQIQEAISTLNSIHHEHEGVICQEYAPRSTDNIQPEERVFYTRENALTIDTIRHMIDRYSPQIRPYLLASLLVKASIHTNTSGVFKGFHKKDGVGHFGGKGENDVTLRIKRPIVLDMPIFSDQDHRCDVYYYNRDILEIISEMPMLDLVYLDPPYNQHPYGSNYFMLNTILRNQAGEELSRVSGIPKDWNHSDYNYKKSASTSLQTLLMGLRTKTRYIILSYNNEGIIEKQRLIDIFNTVGYSWNLREITYQTYRGSRNLKQRDNTVQEYLWILRNTHVN